MEECGVRREPGQRTDEDEDRGGRGKRRLGFALAGKRKQEEVCKWSSTGPVIAKIADCTAEYSPLFLSPDPTLNKRRRVSLLLLLRVGVLRSC